jgi:fatty acid desaturase
VDWYWLPIEREALAALTRKSDVRGALQTFGFLGILALTGSAAWYSAERWPWFVTGALLFLHGTGWAFLSNGFHEFSHGTVFATRGLNRAFLYVFAFLGWNNLVLFWASHSDHHKFAMYPDDDLEEGLYVKPTLRDFLLSAVINPLGLYRSIKGTLRHARGHIEGRWEQHLFPDSRPEQQHRLRTCAWMILSGHAAIIAVAIYFKLWLLPVVITLAPFYGGGIQWLCNQTQHAGLPLAVPDFRLCSRTIYLNPLLQFLYWHMNFHTEHHIYAAVPCYRLARLHRLVKEDMPPCPRGLLATWLQINRTLQRQKVEPGHEYYANVPPRRARATATRGALPR